MMTVLRTTIIDYTQLMPPEAISANDGDSDHDDIMAHNELEEVSTRFVWEDFPPWRPGFNPGSRKVGFCGGQKWRWGRSPPTTSISPANLHSICFSTIIFTITRGWHTRTGMATVPIALRTK
jgi:hypothetical protein